MVDAPNRTSPRWTTLLAALVRRALYAASRPVQFVRFMVAMRQFRAASREQRAEFSVHWRDHRPYLDDRTTTTAFDRHYIYHTAWASRVLAETRPAEHIDIASSLYFVANTSAFVPIRFFDYRPAELGLKGVSSDRADLLSLPFDDRSVASLSCMHVVEHVGLGRYGDPLDPLGDCKAMAELQRVVAAGGVLLFVVPVGRPRVCFNAQRIYSFDMIRKAFSELELVQFAMVPDDGDGRGLIVDPDVLLVNEQANGCGCFWFRRPA